MEIMKLLTVIIFLFTACEGLPLQIMRVSVGNHLGGGRALGIRCHSADVDLGFHTLPDRDAMTWSFRVNVWGTTRFLCDVNLPGASAHRKHFYAYFDQRDSSRCWSRCDWVIESDGRLYARNFNSGGWDYMPYEQ